MLKKGGPGNKAIDREYRLMSHNSSYPPTAIADLHPKGSNPLKMTGLRPIRMY